VNDALGGPDISFVRTKLQLQVSSSELRFPRSNFEFSIPNSVFVSSRSYVSISRSNLQVPRFDGFDGPRRFDGPRFKTRIQSSYSRVYVSGSGVTCVAVQQF
jgi:hypothetical protein